MKRLLCFLAGLCFLFLSCNLDKNPTSNTLAKNPVSYAPVTYNQYGWAVITSFPYAYPNLRILKAVSTQVAWVSDLGLDKIYKTENGGASWIEITPPRGDLSTIEATDSINVWIGTEKGEILKSSDGGNSWLTQFVDPNVTYYINYIEFFDAMNGIAMGDGAYGGPIALLRTTDGGLNWINQNATLNGSTIVYAVNFFNLKYGLLRLNPNKLYWTTTGGQSWIPISFPDYGNIWTLVALDSNMAICSFLSLPSKTTDRGQNWIPLNLPANYYYPARYAKARNHPGAVWAISKNLISSTNNGDSWRPVNTGHVLYGDISAPSFNVVWATAPYGTVTYTTRADTLY